MAAEVNEMEKKNRKLEKLLNIAIKNNAEIRGQKDENEARKEKLKTDLMLLTRDYEKLKKAVDEDKKEIESKMRERDLLNKDVVLAEEKERDKGSAIQTLENELKKLQNKITGYKAESEKLKKLIY
jgi:chromosome segregation ATPase